LRIPQVEFINFKKKGNIMKNPFVCFLLLALYVLGAINGIGYSIYIGEWVTAIGVAVLAAMAWPTAKDCYKRLKE
jgi:uncharacterized membrane protein